jgi:poly(ribitol-phosphate) beta-N-acetylglucosaminyltransferase
MPIKVSVVVPVYNPGPYIDDCIASIRGQTLADDEYEAIFVDDGSTDETPARLDRLAAEQPNVRVIHQQNSGWPGRPRNVGIEAAHGEYVQLLDQDDALGPQALARLHAMAAENDADIVVGKVAANFSSREAGAAHAIRSAPYVLFRKNRPHSSIRDAPLIDSLTPHKLFRTAFLREHGLVFPDGTHRLEDQLFVVPAYFAARNVSVLADYVCYRYKERDDGGNAGSFRIDPATYYGDLRQVIGIVLANTEPGDLRTRLLGRFHRIEMLGRLSEPSFVTHDAAFQRELFDAVRPLAVELIDPAVDARLGAIARLRSRLLRDGWFDGLATLARHAATVRASADLESARWNQGRLAWAVTSRLTFASGEPVRLLRRGTSLILDPRLTEGVADPIDVTDEAMSMRTEVLLVDRSSGARWGSSGTSRVELMSSGPAADGGGDEVWPVIHAHGNLDPQSASAGRPLEQGSFDFWARVTGLGLDREVRVAPKPGWNVDAARIPALLGPPARFVVAELDAAGTVRLHVDPPAVTLDEAIPGLHATAIRDGRELWINLPVAARGPVEGVTASLGFRRGDDETMLPARLQVRGGRLVVAAGPVKLGPAKAGVYSLTVHLGPRGDVALPAGVGRFRHGGRFTMEGADRVGIAGNIRSITRESARSMYEGLPPLVQRAIRGVGRRARRSRSRVA